MSKTRQVRPSVELVLDRTGLWVVHVHNSDGSTVVAQPGQKARVHYDHPERVPRYLKASVVPKLVDEAKLRNMRGER